MKAIVLLANGFEESEALSPVDVMRRADIDVELLSITKDELVVSSHSVRVLADNTLSNFRGDYDLVMLPGGMPGSRNLDASKDVRDIVNEAYTNGKWIAAICAAPMVFGHMGFVNGRRATVYPGFESEMTGATLTGNQVETDGNVITGIGAGASFAFGLELVKALKGKEVADTIKSQIKLLP